MSADLVGSPHTIRAVTYSPSGLFAVGGVSVGTTTMPIVWQSADGEVWDQVYAELPEGATDASFDYISYVDGRLIASGGARRSDDPEEFDFEIFHSTDGRSWQKFGSIPDDLKLESIFTLVDTWSDADGLHALTTRTPEPAVGEPRTSKPRQYLISYEPDSDSWQIAFESVVGEEDFPNAVQYLGSSNGLAVVLYREWSRERTDPATPSAAYEYSIATEEASEIGSWLIDSPSELGVNALWMHSLYSISTGGIVEMIQVQNEHGSESQTSVFFAEIVSQDC